MIVYNLQILQTLSTSKLLLAVGCSTATEGQLGQLPRPAHCRPRLSPPPLSSSTGAAHLGFILRRPSAVTRLLVWVWVFGADGTEYESVRPELRYGDRDREQWHWLSFQFPHLAAFPSLRAQAAYSAIRFFSLLCPFLERMELDLGPWHGEALFSFTTQSSLSLLPPTSHSPTLLSTIHQ